MPVSTGLSIKLVIPHYSDRHESSSGGPPEPGWRERKKTANVLDSHRQMQKAMYGSAIMNHDVGEFFYGSESRKKALPSFLPERLEIGVNL